MAGSTTQKDIGRLEGKVDSIVTMMGGIKGDMTALRNDFMDMEKGRLSKLEVAFATLNTEVSTKAKNAAIWVGVICSVVASVFAAILIRLILG